MKIVHIKNGRFDTIFTPETRSLQVRLDGHGLIITYSPEELIRLSKALWYAAQP